MNSFRMQVEMTNHCNMACVLCPQAYWRTGDAPSGNQFDRDGGVMPLRLWYACLNAAWRHARVLQLGFFGEQMLHPSFAFMLEVVPDERPYTVVLNTNWSLATAEMFPTLRGRVDCLEISLDTMDPVLYDEICPGPRVLGLRAEWRSDRHAAIVEKIEAWLSQPHPMTELVFVTSERNKDERESFAAYWQPKLGPKDVIYQKPAISYGGVVYDPHMKRASCPGVENRITVAWDGRVTPCNLDVSLGLEVGRMEVAADLDDILEGDALKACKERIAKREGICANCFDSNNHGGLIVTKGNP